VGSRAGLEPAPAVSGAEQARAADDQAAEQVWLLLGAEGPLRAVPVIPEADGLSLVLGGLLGLGALAGWRVRRPPGSE
jgi:hypothetical protein